MKFTLVAVLYPEAVLSFPFHKCFTIFLTLFQSFQSQFSLKIVNLQNLVYFSRNDKKEIMITIFTLRIDVIEYYMSAYKCIQKKLLAYYISTIEMRSL